jgi:hypothetical protein
VGGAPSSSLVRSSSQAQLQSCMYDVRCSTLYDDAVRTKIYRLYRCALRRMVLGWSRSRSRVRRRQVRTTRGRPLSGLRGGSRLRARYLNKVRAAGVRLAPRVRSPRSAPGRRASRVHVRSCVCVGVGSAPGNGSGACSGVPSAVCSSRGRACVRSWWVGNEMVVCLVVCSVSRSSPSVTD